MSINSSNSLTQVRGDSRIAGLRANALAAIVMLILEYWLGIWMTLEGHVPSSDHGAGFWGAFLDAITNGPVGLALHALLGTLIIVTSAGLVVRAIMSKRTSWSVLAVVGLLSVLVAWLSGVRFVSTADSGPSFFMALMTGVALLCDVLIVFRLTFESSWSPASPSN